MFFAGYHKKHIDIYDLLYCKVKSSLTTIYKTKRIRIYEQ